MKSIILTFLIGLIAIYFCADFLYDPKLVVFTKPLFIPLFLFYTFLKHREPLLIKYYVFVLFFYLGDIVLLISDVKENYLAVGLFAYFLSYLALINLVNPITKKYNLKDALKGYTLFVVILNCIFLGVVLYLILEAEKDYLIIFVVILNSILAILLTISTVYYLTKNYNIKSFYYFVGSICILMADVFAALEQNYVDIFALNFMGRFLHILGFFAVYLFLIKKETNQMSTSEENYKVI